MGKTEIALRNKGTLQPDQAKDILSKMQSVSPWRIKLEDQKAVKIALPLLEYSLIPATYEQAAYWIGRLLAHFPRRETAKDAIVISDISGDISDKKFPQVAIIAACDELRGEATKDDPWCPPCGEVLNRIRKFSELFSRTNSYLSQNFEDVQMKEKIERLLSKIRSSTLSSPRLDSKVERLEKLRFKPFSKWSSRENYFFGELSKWDDNMEKYYSAIRATFREGRRVSISEITKRINAKNDAALAETGGIPF